MKPTTISWRVVAVLACCAPFLASSSAASSQDARKPAPGGNLHPLDPDEVHDPNDLKDAFSRDFDRDRWEERLRQEDLDQRERSLDALLKRAHVDPIARAFLEELAKDPKGGELAWTARLALRELGRPNFAWQGFQPGADPLGSARRMQEWMDQLFDQQGFGLRPPHPATQTAPGQKGLPALRGMQPGAPYRWRWSRTRRAPARASPRRSTAKRRQYQGEPAEILELNPELEGPRRAQHHVQAGTLLDLQFDGQARRLRLLRQLRSSQRARPRAPGRVVRP
jgi:hypothetical protein